jgi:hypothetical protein
MRNWLARDFENGKARLSCRRRLRGYSQRMDRRRSRRYFLATFGLGAAVVAAGCGRGDGNRASLAALSDDPSATPARPGPQATTTASPAPTSTAIPTPTPRPAGHEVRALMAGSRWETAASIRSTGVAGPALVVLGGVHGNEPGGWLAADEVAGWMPGRGVLAVLPRANVLAIARFERLIEGEGDLNRQYPGDAASETPMSRLAAEITALARELEAEVLLDLHESWAFYITREAAGFENRAQAGTAYLGQTITGGVGPRGYEIPSQIAAAVNSSITVERDLFIARDGTPFARNDSTAPTNRGRSSLALGGHVRGLTPVLVETGQEDQRLERRRELHLAVVRATMDLLEM